MTLEQHIAEGPHAWPAVVRIAREIVLAVETLHALGIVHGAIHPRNIFITGARAVRLTHVSPLLYNDPEADIEPLFQALEAMGCGRFIATLGKGARSLPDLATRLAAAAKADSPDAPEARIPADVMAQESERDTGRARRVRWGSLIAAAAVAALGGALAWGLWWYASHDAKTASPSLPHTSLVQPPGGAA